MVTYLHESILGLSIQWEYRDVCFEESYKDTIKAIQKTE